MAELVKRVVQFYVTFTEETKSIEAKMMSGNITLFSRKIYVDLESARSDFDGITSRATFEEWSNKNDYHGGNTWHFIIS
jgi:hypothetical protein